MKEKAVSKKSARAEVEHTNNQASPFDSFATSPVKKRTTKAKTASKKVHKKSVAVKKLDSKGQTLKSTTHIAPTKNQKSKTLIAPLTVVTDESYIPASTPPINASEPNVEISPAFKILAEPVLPKLHRENRARLMMQTPTELYFYWSVRENPYQLLRKAFGSDTGSYTLVIKLTNLNSGEEELHSAEAEGNWWFHVEPNGKYEAEIGFYAPNRPYFRIIYSNTIETPRRAPSPRPATEAIWTVSANKFAEVLDVAGFKNDAVDVAMAGDDPVTAEAVAHTAFANFAGVNGDRTRDVAGEDIRYALRALASGSTLSELRNTVGSKLFGVLQSRSADLSAERAVKALADHFEIDESEYMEEEEAGPTVFGASLVNFPRTLRPRRPVDNFGLVSSHSYPLSAADGR
jgi:hypothetical protein